MIEMKYNEWLQKATDDPALTEELQQIAHNDAAIRDRFYRRLEFGTAGLRGILGAGTNRMNIYTVRQATQGMADYINGITTNGSVAIGYDSRLNSELFAREAARVLAANGITAHLYPRLMPTPCLSFAVRELNCTMGIMVTASHNPAKYNGYKAYGSDGCQITDETAAAVLKKITAVSEFDDVKLIPFTEGTAAGLIRLIGDRVVERYYDCVLKQSIHRELVKEAGFKVTYTPLNGTGNEPVREILKRIGISELTVVPEQELPDGNFTTCPYPNPEIREALALGIDLCKKSGSHLLLATDPDCDRVGIAVQTADDFKLLTGNEVGYLLLDYIASQRKAMGTLPPDPVAVKTIVTGDLTDHIAESHGVELRKVLTGFKYIGDVIASLEEKGEEDRFIFGFEESYGYLAGSYVRDKDAVVASMLICEMAAFYWKQGKSLADVLESLYKKYGYFLCGQHSYTFEGESGMAKMDEIMKNLRTEPLLHAGEAAVKRFGDYKEGFLQLTSSGEKTPTGLPCSNVLSYELSDGCKAIVRPSGTEPKIKLYTFAAAEDHSKAAKREEELTAFFAALLQ